MGDPWVPHEYPIGTPKTFHGHSMGCPQTPHGRPMDTPRTLHWMLTDTQRTPNGRSMDTPRQTRGLPMNNHQAAHKRPMGGAWTLRAPHELTTDIPWTTHQRLMANACAPDGVSMECAWAARQEPVCCPCSPWGVHGAPWRYPWAAHGVSMGRPRGIRGQSMGCPWEATRAFRGVRQVRGVSLWYAWVAHGHPTDTLCVPYRNVTGVLRAVHERPMDPPWTPPGRSIGCPRRTRGQPTGGP